MRSAEDCSTAHEELGLPWAMLVKGRALLLFILRSLFFDCLNCVLQERLGRSWAKPVLGH